MQFKKATASASKLRLGLAGVSGGGKTFTALSIAKGIGGRVCLIDTENNSSLKYSKFFDFDQGDLKDYSSDGYIGAIKAAEREGYNVIIIDSLTHAWERAKDDAAEAAARSKSKNTYTAWKDVTPRYKKIQNAIIQSSAHIIGTYRVKDEYVLDEHNKPKRVGMGIEAGKHQEYEFDIVLEMEEGGKAIVSKTRYAPITGKVFTRPGDDFGKELADWLSDGLPLETVRPVVLSTVFEQLKKDIFSAASREELMNVALVAKSSESKLLPIELAELRSAYKQKELSLG